MGGKTGEELGSVFSSVFPGGFSACGVTALFRRYAPRRPGPLVNTSGANNVFLLLKEGIDTSDDNLPYRRIATHGKCSIPLLTMHL